MLTITRPSYTELERTLNRNKQENQGYFLLEDHPVIDMLQDHDDTLQIAYNARKGKYRVLDQTFHCIMQVPYETLDSRTVEHIKRIDTRTGYRAIDQINAVEAALEREKERRENDMIQDFAKEFKEAAHNVYNYGRTSGYQKYVNGV